MVIKPACNPRVNSNFYFMKVKLIILFAVLTLPFLASGQGNACDCLANLNETIKKTEENYAGFPAKENAGYHTLVGSLQSKAVSEQEDPSRLFRSVSPLYHNGSLSPARPAALQPLQDQRLQIV